MRLLMVSFPLLWMTCLQADPRFNQGLPKEPVKAVEPEMHSGALNEIMLYDSAVGLFKAKRFKECESTFHVLVDSFPKTPEAEKAGYMLGYLYVHNENQHMDYAKARSAFERFLTQYPDSRYVSDSRSWIHAIAIMDSLEKRPVGLKDSNLGVIEENRRLKAEIEELKQVIERLERIIKKN